MFTYSYKQPEEYRFSLDSIHLAEYVAQEIQSKTNLSSLRVLDLCAGCGVVGFELSWYVRDLRQFDFVEVQDIYTDYFYENITVINRPELQLQWHIVNYDVLLEKSWGNKFDLIVSNPPYFLPHQGAHSPSSFKNRCRFFLDSSFENYIAALNNVLAPQGKAYFLLRPLEQHGYDLFSQAEILLKNTDTSIKIISQIRGTHLVLLSKK